MTPRVPLGRVLADTSRQYWGRTSVSGLSNAHSAEWRPLRLIWLGLFVVGLVFTVMDVVYVISDFLDYPHATQMDVVYDKSAHFPAVTVCSQSRIDCERLLNASLQAPEDKQLSKILRTSDCLKPNGLQCPYVWALVAGTATSDWLADHKSACLQCDLCGKLQGVLSNMQRKNNDEMTALLEKLLVTIGCNTTCLPPAEEEAGSWKGNAEGESPAAAGEGVPPDGEDAAGDDAADDSAAESAGTGTDSGVLRTRTKRAAKNKRTKWKKKLDPSSFKASQSYDDSMQSLTDFMMLTEDQRISIGIAQEDFIKECTYLGTSCNNELLFRTVSSPQFGNCFTFNTNVTESPDPLAGERITGLTGEHYSLDLLLDIKHHSFPPVVATKGARVQVHQPDHQPDVEDSGISVLPNAATSFAIEQLTIQRLPYPYAADCISFWELAEYLPNSTDDEEIKESYSVTRCKKMCLQGLFMERCGCFHAMYPMPGSFRRRESAKEHARRPCLLTVKGKDNQCTADIQQQFDNGTVHCHCPSACYEKAFNVFQSMAEWPRDTYLATAAGRMDIDISDLTPATRRELASNILEVKVFFKTLNTATLLQYPEYSFRSFLSSLGGAMSLYLGISVIMVAEILEFFCLLGWNLYRRAKGRYVSSVTPEPAEPKTVGDVKKVAIRPHGIEISYIDVRQSLGHTTNDCPSPPLVK